jgi:MarR family transcriptional regulator, lower aerobic nicotinate degradation pathway regulator
MRSILRISVYFKSKDRAIDCGSARVRTTAAGIRRNALPRTKKRHAVAAQKPWPLPQRPGFLIRRLHQIHVALFQKCCGAFEVTPLQYSLLSALAVRGTADQTTLAADIALDRTTTTGALKRLAARNLVERVVSRDDRRARACKLTSAGAALLRRIERSAREAHRATLGHLTTAEQAIFIGLMQRIVADNANQDSSAATLNELA